jgi:hypothetical protein
VSQKDRLQHPKNSLKKEKNLIKAMTKRKGATSMFKIKRKKLDKSDDKKKRRNINV